MAKLRIVHVSDLHLFVEADGTKRPFAQVGWIAGRALQFARSGTSVPLVGGFEVHEDSALEALLTTITRLAEDPEMPMIVIQSGDVSTFGCRHEPAGVSFPEWEFWRSQAAVPRVSQPKAWIDLYGNHDVWPGALPLMGFWHVQEARDELRRQHHRDQLPQRHAIDVDGHRVEVYVVNTVQHTAIANTLADGTIDFDHPDPTAPHSYPCGTSDPLNWIEHMARLALPRDPAARVFRIVVMHHPPHFFGSWPSNGARWYHKLTSGVLTNAQLLTGWLQHVWIHALPFELVLAGHRHELDPPAGSRPGPLRNTRAIQLVCGTPTQTGADHSLSVYEMELDTHKVSVTRTVYTRAVTDDSFQPSITDRII